MPRSILQNHRYLELVDPGTRRQVGRAQDRWAPARLKVRQQTGSGWQTSRSHRPARAWWWSTTSWVTARVVGERR